MTGKKSAAKGTVKKADKKPRTHLIEARERRGWSRKRVAELAGFRKPKNTQKNVERAEDGEELELKTIQGLQQAFGGASADWVLNGIGEPPKRVPFDMYVKVTEQAAGQHLTTDQVERLRAFWDEFD